MSVVAETQRAPSGQAPVRPSRGRRLQLAAMAFLAYGIALIQRPGEAVVDTRLELSVDPTVFLERVFHLWSATTDFGHVQGGQFNGYLFPMAPWFAAGDQLDIPMWILQRLWLGTLLLLAAWGAARLMDALLERPNLVASSGAALLFALNPYVVLFTSRGTVTLLAHAALPWLMLAVHRGLRRPTGWVMPAAIGLILAASGGGVNAAVIAFALLGPIALAGYEVATRRVALSAVASFGWRAAVAAAVGSAVVGDPGAAAEPLRDRHPHLHRATVHDLGHHELPGAAAVAGLLGPVHGRRLRRAGALHGRGGHLSVQPGGDRRHLPGPALRRRDVPAGPRLALRPVLRPAGLSRPPGHVHGLPAGGPAP